MKHLYRFFIACTVLAMGGIGGLQAMDENTVAPDFDFQEDIAVGPGIMVEDMQVTGTKASPGRGIRTGKFTERTGTHYFKNESNRLLRISINGGGKGSSKLCGFDGVNGEGHFLVNAGGTVAITVNEGDACKVNEILVETPGAVANDTWIMVKKWEHPNNGHIPAGTISILQTEVDSAVSLHTTTITSQRQSQKIQREAAASGVAQ